MILGEWPFREEAFNTLAQTGTENPPQDQQPAVLIVNGEGSELKNSRIVSRGKKKLITQRSILCLVDIAKRKGHYEMVKSYWNTYHCQERVFTSANKMYTTYCKNRFCTVCTAIRKADFINRYLPVLNTWEEPHFVTLSLKSCPAKKLRFYCKSVLRALNEILAKYKKRYQRNLGAKIMCIRSLECNFNPIAKTYNPHLHIIVQNKSAGDILVKEWLRKWTSEWTYKKGQKNDKVFNKEKALIEVIKYGSKIFTEPDMIKKKKPKGTAFIYVAALHNILMAMKGLRIFERSGFNCPKIEKLESKRTILTEWEEWHYRRKYMDWLNTDGCQLLLGYMSTEELLFMLNNQVDMVTS